MPRKKIKNYKIGELIKILWPPTLAGTFGLVVGHGLGLTPEQVDWRVHLPDGRDVWFRQDEITKFKQNKKA